MDTVERRRYWKDVEVLAAQAKRLPDWMRGREEHSKTADNSRVADRTTSGSTKPRVNAAG
jgi:hypothetical protein